MTKTPLTAKANAAVVILPPTSHAEFEMAAGAVNVESTAVKLPVPVLRMEGTFPDAAAFELPDAAVLIRVVEAGNSWICDGDVLICDARFATPATTQASNRAETFCVSCR